jgi:carbamoyltransferase
VAGDCGTAIGAAVATHQRHFGPCAGRRLEHLYWGREFSDEEIAGCLATNGEAYSLHEDIGSAAGKLLADGRIVGWFQGRQEAGPRALGNRSILADPRRKANAERLNRAVKRREPWRPFAPSILNSSRHEYLEEDCDAPFMIMGFRVRRSRMSEIQAAVHVDGTARPQTVDRSTNPLLWSVIRSFQRETTVPAVLNTSFNKRGEPVVCTPQEAVDLFRTSDMDCLVMGNYLVDKRHPSR